MSTHHQFSVRESLDRINEQIELACERRGRNPAEINMIAVTKYVSVNRMQEAFAAGIEHIGENKVQDAADKYEQLNGRGTWHFIGHLQSNKVKDVIGKFSMIHSLDRPSLAKEINKRASIKNIEVPCFVQVNISGEESKHGLAPEKVEGFIQSLADYKHIKVIGLMTMAPFVEDPEDTRPIFRQLKQLQQKLEQRQWDHAPLHECSMGMSNDFQVAIEEGATYIRLGTSLVGNELKSH